MKKATSLKEISAVFKQRPLETQAELKALYRDELNQIRQNDLAQRLNVMLANKSDEFLKVFLTGHPGVGKSTELSRLVHMIEDGYQVVRFSAQNELDPSNFQPFDILILMMTLITEKATLPLDQGGTGYSLTDGTLHQILDWFAEEHRTLTREAEFTGETEFGVGTKGTVWEKLMGVFASARAKMKVAANRKTELVDYRMRRISDLIGLLNALLDECNALLTNNTGKKWLFIAEDFEKGLGDNRKQIRELLLNNGAIFTQLNANFIFTIPIYLAHSTDAAQLPLSQDCILSIPDIPVYSHNPVRTGQPYLAHTSGRQAVQSVIESRMDISLFEPNRMVRLIVATGGNLRDLFSSIIGASISAQTKSADPLQAKITKSEVDEAITNLHRQYQDKLGEGAYEEKPITYSEKADRLVRLYNQEADACVPDPILRSLLQTRAVQEFAGEPRFGLHPIVVDLLGAQNKISRQTSGAVSGGSE